MNRKRFALHFSVLLIIVFALSACQSMANNAIKGNNVPTPESGKSTVTGRVLNSSGIGIKNIAVRLAAVYRQGGQGAFVLDLARSPGSFTDKNGYFIVKNIEVKEYAVVVGEPDAEYTIIADSKGQARTWKAETGKVIDIGDLKVNINP